MLFSKTRPVVVPQSEHARLAGMLAMLWGNDHFDLPPMSKSSFVVGVTFHDCGYGFLDDHPVPDSDEEKWLQQQRQGYLRTFENPAVELVVKFHIRRLLRHSPSKRREECAKEIDAAIDHLLQRLNWDQEPFERADRITQFCDNVAFDFCFETSRQGSLAIFPKNDKDETVEVSYSISPEGHISADPWPFSTRSYEGYIVGYKQHNYPQSPEPTLLPFLLATAKT